MTSSPAAREGGSPEDPSPLPPAPLQRRSLLALAAIRVATSIAVLSAGLRAISDDDYSRVVIAQQWAASPKLDPTGTSWLPFPFWLQGGVMIALGRSLFVAQAIAIALGIASTLVVAEAARLVTRDRRAALFSGIFATLIGWSAWLGVATVPELFTASLTLFAASSLTVTSPRTRAIGAFAMLAATLSRYEPWPVALAFAAWSAIDLTRRSRAPVRSRIAIASCSIVAIAGPALWIAWNRVAHGDPFHFVARVTAYRRALGEATNESVLARLAAYPVALAKEMPEVAILFVAALAIVAIPSHRRTIARTLRAHAAPLILAIVQIAALSVALVKDGAPTHHPERAVLFPAFAMALFVAHVAASLVAPATANGPAHGRVPRILVSAISAALFARAAATPLLDRSFYAHRESEVAMGRLVASAARPQDRALIEVTDYGYFAIEAASGRPEMFETDRVLDPRWGTAAPTYSSDDARLQDLRARGVAFVIDAPETAALRTPRFKDSLSKATERHRLSALPPAN